MLHLFHIDLVVIPVRTDPFDPYDALLEVDRHGQPIIVSLDVEHHVVTPRRCWQSVVFP
jgi:hypothetical protein